MTSQECWIDFLKRKALQYQDMLDDTLAMLERASPQDEDHYWTVDDRHGRGYEVRVASIHEDNDE